MNSILTAQHVTKSFYGNTAVNDVSCEIRRNEILGLIGANGAGKTTFFNCLTGIYKIDSGEIRFEGKKINGLKPYKICDLGIARTFQIVRPFPGLTTLENVMTGAFCRVKKYKNALEIAEQSLSFVGLEDKIYKQASELNTGDQRKLELARALSTKPNLLLLDEVMAGLTPTESESVMEVIRKIRDDGITILMIEHIVAALMSLSDRVIVFDRGCLISSGTPQEVSKDPKVIESYLGRQDETNA